MNIIAMSRKGNLQKVLIELTPGPRTISWWTYDPPNQNRQGQLHFKHIHFPWTYFYLSLGVYENARNQIYFGIHDFQVHTANEKLQGKMIENRQYFSYTGSNIIFPNMIDGGMVHVLCLGEEPLPVKQNLYDSLQSYLRGFFEIPFTSGRHQATICEEEAEANYHALDRLDKLPVGRGHGRIVIYDPLPPTTNFIEYAKSLYPTILEK